MDVIDLAKITPEMIKLAVARSPVCCSPTAPSPTHCPTTRPPSTPRRPGRATAAAGTATGTVRIVQHPSEARIQPGDILVAPTTDPGWTPLFMTIAGLVTETGSPICPRADRRP